MKRNKYYRLVVLSFAALFLCTCAWGEHIADGVTLTPLTNDGKSTSVSWAYRGDKIAFVRKVSNSQKQLMIMKSDGTGEETITPIGNPFFAKWSWSGKKLSYEFSNADTDESQGGVYVYDVATKKSLPVSGPYLRESLDPDDGPFWSADDQYVVYKVRIGPSQTRQLWVANTRTGQARRLLANRGQGKEAHFSPFAPTRISLQIESGGGSFDIATVSPDSRDLVLLTNIGSQSIGTNKPRWSPTGEWITFGSNIDMTQNERDNGRKDCWIARPDGSEARNLTNATSPATEEQLKFDEIFWSWDGRWILAEGERLDKQGKGIDTLYLIDPVNGGYSPILTSYPRETGELNEIETLAWSYDSTKIAIVIKRVRVKNWGADVQKERTRWVLILYDVLNRKTDEIFFLDEELDRKKILAELDMEDLENISWSPDGRSIVLTIGDIISKDIVRPDIYRLDLPARFIAASAAQNIGPPIGRKAISVEQPTATERPLEPSVPKKTVAVTKASAIEPEIVTEIVRPLHMTLGEVTSSLPSSYGQYITTNPTRNFFLFKGPSNVLAAFRKDLRLIDSRPPHVLVDLLAVELSDEANRNLGLDWAYVEGHFGFIQPLSGVGQSFYQGVGTLPSAFFIRLNTLVRDGEGTILANPRTVAMSGKESSIQIRKTLNYFFNEGFDEQSQPIVKKSDISSDTVGRITPTLLADGRIHLLVDVSVGSFTFTPDAGLPEQTSREAKTEVTVKEGETIVIGGLRQQEMSKVIQKVPILGDIPIINGLFKRVETDMSHSVLTIFITPRVMREDNPAPEWPIVSPENHKCVPIMAKRPSSKRKAKMKDSDVQQALDNVLSELTDD